jgi:ankyrin repeat protein
MTTRSAFILFVITSLFLNCFNSQAQSTLLLNAIKANNLQEVTALLDEGVSPNIYDDDSDHSLMNGALYASAECMEMLIKKGADVNAKNKLGETALMWSAHDFQKTKLLLENGARVNDTTRKRNTALLIACVGNNQHEIVKLLLQNGADPHIANTRKETTLIRVALFGDTSTAALLLAKGVDINAQNIVGETVLRTAVVSSNIPMAYWALRNGADPNIGDIYNSPPLTYAMQLDDLGLVKTFLSTTKNINLIDTDGLTFLMWAVYNEHDNPAIIQALLDSGADLNIKRKDGTTALSLALKKGNTATVEMLKKAGAK